MHAYVPCHVTHMHAYVSCHAMSCHPYACLRAYSHMHAYVHTPLRRFMTSTHSHVYNIRVHIHRDCACAFHLHSHLERNAPPSETRIMNRDAACALQRTAVLREARTLRTLTVLFSVVFSVDSRSCLTHR